MKKLIMTAVLARTAVIINFFMFISIRLYISYLRRTQKLLQSI